MLRCIVYLHRRQYVTIIVSPQTHQLDGKGDVRGDHVSAVVASKYGVIDLAHANVKLCRVDARVVLGRDGCDKISRRVVIQCDVRRQNLSEMSE